MSKQTEAQRLASMLTGHMDAASHAAAAELLRQEALIAELAVALKDCSEYLSDIPESAVGGDDEAGRINRRAIAALAKVQQ